MKLVGLASIVNVVVTFLSLFLAIAKVMACYALMASSIVFGGS